MEIRSNDADSSLNCLIFLSLFLFVKPRRRGWDLNPSASGEATGLEPAALDRSATSALDQKY